MYSSSAGILSRPAAIVGSERVAIATGGSAGDTMLMASGILSGGLPTPVVGHRTLDREHATAVVGDDQVERCKWTGLGHVDTYTLTQSKSSHQV